MNTPLAERMRPRNLDEVVGQKHLIGENKILKNLIDSGNIPNMIFYGPSGTGKTTVANIAAMASDKQFYKLNATNASLSDIKAITAELGENSFSNGILLYLDEIQNFNKKQQQSLLEFIETGDITLIASTTENPYFYVYNAILSRSSVFEFKPIEADDVKEAVLRAIGKLQKEMPENKIVFDPQAVEHISAMSNGDVRKALNAVEVCIYSVMPDMEGMLKIDLETAEQASQKTAMTYDKLGDNHYDILSAFQKSIRGSDANAAIHYMARLIAAGDIISVCRRLMVIACEDIGLAYPQAVSIVKSCVDCAFQLGLPEARIPLAEAVILLATAPKSNSAICAIDEALADIEKGNCGEIPLHLKDSHYKGAAEMGRGVEYKYPHSYPNHYVDQQYLPDVIKDRKYYVPGENKFEQNSNEYWNKIKNGK
ncbi:MAG: replication-associated recombination protein A [Clostridia bacterium]|nr:replication-associated recombination protein A [Clostridia bacterium]